MKQSCVISDCGLIVVVYISFHFKAFFVSTRSQLEVSRLKNILRIPTIKQTIVLSSNNVGSQQSLKCSDIFLGRCNCGFQCSEKTRCLSCRSTVSSVNLEDSIKYLIDKVIMMMIGGGTSGPWWIIISHYPVHPRTHSPVHLRPTLQIFIQCAARLLALVCLCLCISHNPDSQTASPCDDLRYSNTIVTL